MPDGNLCSEHSGLLKDIKAIRREMNINFKLHNRGIESAKLELDRRLEAMNEFRAQLDKQAQEFMTRTEIELLALGLRKDVESNRGILDQLTGAKKWSDHIIMALIGLGVIFVVWLITRGGI